MTRFLYMKKSHTKTVMLKMSHNTLDLDGLLGITEAMKNGHEIWNLKCKVDL
jgi:hypothetical protein